MARNKYPEDTIKKILEVSAKLFIEKGYDNTSMQDIVRHLGMSKGAIYHHFKSKEELLNKVVEEFFSNMDWFVGISQNGSLSGLEKIRALLGYALADEGKSAWDKMAKRLMNDPKMLMEQHHGSLHEAAPMIEQIILEGNEDGSLHVEYPREAAELMLIAANMWISPVLNETDKEHFMRKVYYFKFILEQSGIPVVDDKMIKICERYYERMTVN